MHDLFSLHSLPSIIQFFPSFLLFSSSFSSFLLNIPVLSKGKRFHGHNLAPTPAARPTGREDKPDESLQPARWLCEGLETRRLSCPRHGQSVTRICRGMGPTPRGGGMVFSSGPLFFFWRHVDRDVSAHPSELNTSNGNIQRVRIPPMMLLWSLCSLPGDGEVRLVVGCCGAIALFKPM